MVERITISLPEEVLEALNDHLDYGDNRSQWVENAIRKELDRDRAAEENEALWTGN